MKVVTFAGQPIVAVEDALAESAFQYYARFGVTPDAFCDAVSEDFEFGMLDIPVAESLEGLELVRVVHQLWISGWPDEVTIDLKPRCVLDVPVQTYGDSRSAVPGQLLARAYGLTAEDTARAFIRVATPAA